MGISTECGVQYDLLLSGRDTDDRDEASEEFYTLVCSPLIRGYHWLGRHRSCANLPFFRILALELEWVFYLRYTRLVVNLPGSRVVIAGWCNGNMLGP